MALDWNGVGMLGHLNTSHHKHHPADMGMWDIILEHLQHSQDATIVNLIGAKEAFICKHKGCGYVAVSEKAMMAHNIKQHRSEAQWARETLTIQLGKATPSEIAEDVVKEFVKLHENFFAKKEMTLEEA
jgi:hypothetical protein